MILLFPHLFVTLKAAPYFATTLGGFEDAQGRFKFFLEGEAPELTAVFLTAEILQTDQSQMTDWSVPEVIFHANGLVSDRLLLQEIVNQVRAIFRSRECFEPLGNAAPVGYTLLGRATFGSGFDPVTDRVTHSVALRFGLPG